MLPTINISDVVYISLYSTMFMIGYVLAVMIARRLGPSHGVAKQDVLFVSIYGAVGLFAGAKLVFFLTRLPKIIVRFGIFIQFVQASPLDALNYAFGGLVFYGGLLGGIFGIYLYCKLYKVAFAPFLNLAAPVIPLMHGFGRLGCFFAGCCYGVEYHGFGSVQFPDNEMIPELSAVPRFPVQLLEATLNFVVFLVLLYLLKHVKMRQGQLMGVYLLYYTVARYLLEFLRGDVARGGVGVFSTSQLISLLLLPAGIVLASGKWKMHSEKQ